MRLAGDDFRARNSAATRQKWNSEEEEELRKLFSEVFERKGCPSHDEVISAMVKSKSAQGPIFKNNRKNWETIKKKVRRMVLADGEDQE